MREYHKSDFEIRKYDATYYYISRLGDANRYMHKDGSIHGHCGEENFFESREEARAVIESSIYVHGSTHLPKELFDI